MLKGVSLGTILLIAVVAIVAYHFWAQSQGAVRGKPHKPRPGPGKAAKDAGID